MRKLLAVSLISFVLSVPVFAFAQMDEIIVTAQKGRTTISTYDEISVSVVNPYQYRTDVMKLVTDEVNNVTKALGPEYRVMLSGLDKELKWVRSGDLNLAFYLPYTYDIISDTLHSIQRVYED